MIQIWYCNSSAISKTAFDSYIIHLSPAMQAEILRYRFFKDQLARLVARLMIYKATGYNKELFYNWQRLSNNKPFIPQWKQFSISHAGDYVVVAISETNPIGIDIEQIRATTNVIELANAFCKAEETAVVNALNPKELFFSLWTKKEALLKALGDGLVKDGLNSFNCLDSSAHTGKEIWYFNEVSINTDYKCHLATLTDNTTIVTTQFLPEALLSG